MERDNKYNANAVPLPPDEACNADPARARPDLGGGEGQVANVARACQKEATVAPASQGKHDPSNPPPSLNNQSSMSSQMRHSLPTSCRRAMIWAQQGWELMID